MAAKSAVNEAGFGSADPCQRMESGSIEGVPGRKLFHSGRVGKLSVGVDREVRAPRATAVARPRIACQDTPHRGSGDTQ
jgi:hypothetical protein